MRRQFNSRFEVSFVNIIRLSCLNYLCSSNLTNVGVSANHGLPPTSIRARVDYWLKFMSHLREFPLFWINMLTLYDRWFQKMIFYIGLCPITCFSSDRKVLHVIYASNVDIYKIHPYNIYSSSKITLEVINLLYNRKIKAFLCVYVCRETVTAILKWSFQNTLGFVYDDVVFKSVFMKCFHFLMKALSKESKFLSYVHFVAFGFSGVVKMFSESGRFPANEYFWRFRNHSMFYATKGCQAWQDKWPLGKKPSMKVIFSEVVLPNTEPFEQNAIVFGLVAMIDNSISSILDKSCIK